MCALIVQKYGGTSVGSPERIRSVAKRIAQTKANGHSLIVVVSAMGHTTDELLALAHRVSKHPPHREMDMLLTVGERISMALLSMALADLNVSAVSFTGSQTGIITDGSHRSARIQKILGDRVRQALTDDKVAIVAGFQGVSKEKEITTLGRGGSDTTAVALAATLKANLCEIYTDVDGVYSADPHIVSKARLWKKIPQDLMIEMAHGGAGVLHPRSVELSKQFGVVLCIKNSLNQNEGTEVIARTKNMGMEEFQIVGVTADSTKALVKIELMRPASLASVWGIASQQHFAIIAPTFSENHAIFFAESALVPEWTKHLNRLIQDGFVRTFQFDETQVPLSIVGNRFAQDGSALSSLIETLAQAEIVVSHGVASALVITLAVPKARANDAIKILHKNWIEETPPHA